MSVKKIVEFHFTADNDFPEANYEVSGFSYHWQNWEIVWRENDKWTNGHDDDVTVDVWCDLPETFEAEVSSPKVQVHGNKKYE